MTSWIAVVDDLVADVRAPLVHLEHDLDVDAVRAEVVRRAARRDQCEAEPLEIARDLHHRRLVVVADADERGAASTAVSRRRRAAPWRTRCRSSPHRP